jgi:hypothetical protein
MKRLPSPGRMEPLMSIESMVPELVIAPSGSSESKISPPMLIFPTSPPELMVLLRSDP